MDILANSVVTSDKTAPLFVNEADLPWDKDYPIPTGCSRFILPIAMRQALQDHPLSCDLYPSAAGFYPLDTRHYAIPVSPTFLIYYCIGGNMNLHTAAADWPVASGDLVVIPPKLAHITGASQSSPCTYFWVSYSGELSADYTQFINASEPVVHLGLHPELIAQFEALCNFRTSNFTLDTFVNGANRLKVLLTSISLTLSQKASKNKKRIDLDRVRSFMAQHLDRPLNLRELAESVNLSPHHFARTFKNLTGQSPMHYFTQMRLQQACHLLDTARQPIKQIAATVGYSDPQYFSRIFRRIIGMTPHAYRNWSSPPGRSQESPCVEQYRHSTGQKLTASIRTACGR